MFFKHKYISIYHSDPLSFYLSCHIQQYRYKSYLEGIDGTIPDHSKHFVKTVLRPMLSSSSREKKECDSINIISYGELYSAVMKYYEQYLSGSIERERFVEELETRWFTQKIKGSPNIFIWDDDFWYFSVVTATTTGYGDILPRSEVARKWVGIQIIFSTIIAGTIFAIMGIKFDKPKNKIT
jgi:hypothetical protein